MTSFCKFKGFALPTNDCQQEKTRRQQIRVPAVSHSLKIMREILSKHAPGVLYVHTTLTEWQYVNRNSVSTAIVNKAVVGTFHSIEVGFASACK